MAYVIIGNGIASLGAIDGIRKYDTTTPLIVIGAEDKAAYGRPLTSYILSGKIDPQRLSMRPESYYENKGVALRLSTYIADIDLGSSEVITSGGDTIPFEKLLIATGGIPFAPDVKGLQGDGVYNFTAVKEAYALAADINKIKRAVVVGGGLIGLKAAESLYNRGIEVAVVDSAPRLLSLAYDDEAAGLISRRFEEAGMLVRCGTGAKEIMRDKQGDLRGVLLEDKSFLEADAVVVAIGVTSNTELARTAGIGVDNGIIVNDHMQTDVDNVYAAGDVAQARDVVFNKDKVVPVWSNAYTQGYYAGKNMAGKVSDYPGSLSMSSISFFGMPTISVGEVHPDEDDPDYEAYSFYDEVKQSYRKLVFKGDQLVGYVLVGDIDFAGMYTSFIRFKFKVDSYTRKKLSGGKPDVLMWPDEFFNKAWNPESE